MEKDKKIEMIYDELLSSICFNVANGMHRMAKTGEMKLSMLPQKPDTPSTPTNTYTYNTNSPAKKRARSSSSLTPAEDNSLSDSIKLGTVRNWRDVQSTSDTKGQMKTLSMKKKDTNSTNNDSEEPLKLARNLENNTYTEKINKTRPQRSKHARGSHLDVWNRVAPKDVTAQCTNCNKIVGISRFAVHLDKCMGIGNVRKSSIHS